MTDEDELPEAKSYERYWWDCPVCGGTNDSQDIQPANEELECEECGATVLVS